MRRKPSLSTLLIAALIAAPGTLSYILSAQAQDSGDGGETGNDTESESFSSAFSTLNSQNLPANASANAEFQVTQDTFTAVVNAESLTPDTQIIQHIHVGPECPTPEDDINNDGFIDAVEAEAVSGKILIPLDDTLAQQAPAAGASPTPAATPVASPSPDSSPVAGYRNETKMFAVLRRLLGGQYGLLQNVPPGYPVTDASGNYNYNQSAPLAEMLADLRAADPNPDDSLAKLGPDEELNLGQRVITIHGVPATTQLPPTVASTGGLPAHLTLPVACGQIVPTASDDIPEPEPTPEPEPSPVSSLEFE